ncbi:hypothetical protein O181_037331 [Austropuccinia psidii MF-1]|uniref:Uncharacterized protein n=1 Tax=Austropuccinia psidii MF-1 TaxID=1389203 RepID=A0A9Q3DBW9_9BASI|nr:hypothetical protein [Austropuccinia psidii MF-1]
MHLLSRWASLGLRQRARLAGRLKRKAIIDQLVPNGSARPILPFNPGSAGSEADLWRQGFLTVFTLDLSGLSDSNYIQEKQILGIKTEEKIDARMGILVKFLTN